MERISETYLPWFILRALPCVGNQMVKKLIAVFGKPENILSASQGDLNRIPGLGPSAINAILTHKRHQTAALDQLHKILDQGCHILTYTDHNYPVLLKEIPDPPMVVFYKGEILKEAPCLSIVGSRKATSYGRNTAGYLSEKLAHRGFTIVSGMAEGIDTAAHKGALNARGRTIAVLGSGLNRIYPRQNSSLYNDISQQGAVLSEFEPDAPPIAKHFPVRNRIIAGLSCGTLVVEAAQRSGSLITARLAGEYNREVFAVPGSIKSSRSRGTHQLIKQGAQLVENEMDIIDELHHFIHPAPRHPQEGSSSKTTPYPSKKINPVMDKDQALVYKHLDSYPRDIDSIIDAAGLKSSRVTAILTELELSGIIYRHPGNLFSLSEE